VNITLGTGWVWHIVYIACAFEVGLFLMIFPWLSIWQNNIFIILCPGLLPWISSPYVKGAVLGLGIVNITIGVQGIVGFKHRSQIARSGR